MELEIQFANKHQVVIADLLWNAQDEKAVKMILKTFGHEGQVVHQMMIAASMDQVSETALAEQALTKIFKG